MFTVPPNCTASVAICRVPLQSGEILTLLVQEDLSVAADNIPHSGTRERGPPEEINWPRRGCSAERDDQREILNQPLLEPRFDGVGVGEP